MACKSLLRPKILLLNQMKNLVHSHCKGCFQILASSCKHQTDLSEGTPLYWFHNILTDLMTKLQPWNGVSIVWCFMGTRHKVRSSTVQVSPFETWTCFEPIWTREGSKTCNVQWNFLQTAHITRTLILSLVSTCERLSVMHKQVSVQLT